MAEYCSSDIKEYLVNGTIPEIFTRKQRTYFVKKSNDYYVKGSFLFVKRTAKFCDQKIEKDLRVVMDSLEKKQILTFYHNGMEGTIVGQSFGAHLGINRTRTKITEKYW